MSSEVKELVDKWLIESRTEKIKGKTVAVNHFLRSVNVATYNDIIKNPEKYKDIVILFVTIDQLTDYMLKDVITLNIGRWHVAGDILDIYPNYADRHKRNLVQSWASPTTLIELMMARITPKYAWVIIRKEH